MGSAKRYASAAIILGGGAIGGAALLGSASNPQRQTGMPFNYNGKQYYVKGDSQRARYPSKEACMRDVPLEKQSECEPVNSYRPGASGYYGPLYSSRDTGYKPNPQYPSEPANQSNFGKKFPSSANTSGFGENGKAFTGSKGS